VQNLSDVATLTIALTARTQSVYVIDQFFFPSKDFQGLLQLERCDLSIQETSGIQDAL